MATSNPRKDEPKLTIIIRNREPLRLGDVAPLLAAIGADYANVTGRQLTLRSARQGSLELDLVEAGRYGLEVAGAFVTMKEFAALVKKTIEKAKKGITTLRSKRAKGAKTADAMVQVSRASHADLELTYHDDKEALSVTISREEAERLYEAAFRPKRPTPRVTHRGEEPVGFRDSDIAKFAIAALENGTLDESNGTLELLRMLVRSLQSQPNGEARLSEIEKTLKAQGQGRAASLLRDLIV